jgi:hypothetical protein
MVADDARHGGGHVQRGDPHPARRLGRIMHMPSQL